MTNTGLRNLAVATTVAMAAGCVTAPDFSGIDVPGSRANPLLQKDTSRLLWKLSSKEYGADFQFEVVEAKPAGPGEISFVGRSSEEAMRLERYLLSRGLLWVERWTVRCCGESGIYEVVFMDSPKGGTDVAAGPFGQASD